MAVVLDFHRDRPAVASMKTYGKVTYRKRGRAGFWVLEDVPPHVRIRLKEVFRSQPQTEVKSFAFRDLNDVCADLVWFLSRYPMAMSDVDRERLEFGRQEFDRLRADNEAIMLPDWQPPPRVGFRPPYLTKVYHGQWQAVELLHRLKRLLVMDDVGLGKTWIALLTLAGSPEYLPAAIVVQSHMPSQWVKEFIEPMTYMTAHVIKGRSPYALPPANLYIFKYSNIASWVDIASTGFFKAVIFDEIQELRRGEETWKGRAAKIFAENAVLRCGLSASPIFNYGSEIFHIIEMIEPGALGTWDEFTREWCHMGAGDKWIVDDPEALGTYLREKLLVIRRERQGRKVNKLPIELDWDDDAAKQDDALTKALAITVLRGGFHESGQAARELDAHMRRVTGLAKARAVAAYARMLLHEGKPIIIFGWHRDVYRVWQRELAEFNPMLYTGTESNAQKDRAKAALISGKTKLVLMSLRSGAGLDGIQLVCKTLLFGELDWSPKIHDPQCIGRVDRPGQPADEIDAFYFWTNGGSDPLVMQVHGVKGSQARGIVDPTKGVEQIYTDESRVKMLARDYLERMGVSV